MSGLIYEETRDLLKIFLENVIHDALTYMEHARRKTVTTMDVVYALKRYGSTLYGFRGGGLIVFALVILIFGIQIFSNFDIWFLIFHIFSSGIWTFNNFNIWYFDFSQFSIWYFDFSQFYYLIFEPFTILTLVFRLFTILAFMF